MIQTKYILFSFIIFYLRLLLTEISYISSCSYQIIFHFTSWFRSVENILILEIFEHMLCKIIIILPLWLTPCYFHREYDIFHDLNKSIKCKLTFTIRINNNLNYTLSNEWIWLSTGKKDKKEKVFMNHLIFKDILLVKLILSLFLNEKVNTESTHKFGQSYAIVYTWHC